MLTHHPGIFDSLKSNCRFSPVASSYELPRGSIRLGVGDYLLCCFKNSRSRRAGAHKDSERCEVEASHIHNMPSMIKDYKDGKLLYYFDIEVPLFISRSDGVNINCFEPLWEDLRQYIEQSYLRETDGNQ